MPGGGGVASRTSAHTIGWATRRPAACGQPTREAGRIAVYAAHAPAQQGARGGRRPHLSPANPARAGGGPLRRRPSSAGGAPARTVRPRCRSARRWQGVLEALGADLAGEADLLGLAGGAALLGEEGLGVGLGAQRALLPAEFLVRVVDQQLLRPARPCAPLVCLSRPRDAAVTDSGRTTRVKLQVSPLRASQAGIWLSGPVFTPRNQGYAESVQIAGDVDTPPGAAPGNSPRAGAPSHGVLGAAAGDPSR
ncbi:hypothetical protein SHIRM173S_10356 [Streptomyces hirsutus]